MSNYPPGTTQADHDRAHQDAQDSPDQPGFFVFTKVMHVAVAADSKDKAVEILEDLFDSPKLEIHYDADEWEL